MKNGSLPSSSVHIVAMSKTSPNFAKQTLARLPFVKLLPSHLRKHLNMEQPLIVLTRSSDTGLRQSGPVQ